MVQVIGSNDLVTATTREFGCRWVDDPPTYSSELIRTLVRHWFTLRETDGGNIPARSAIDPLAIPHCLAQVYIYEADDANPGDFFCRLVGEQIAWNFDIRLKGRRLSEILQGQSFRNASTFMRTCIEVPAIYRNFGQLYADDSKREANGERVFLPLCDDQGRRSFVIGMTDVTVEGEVPDEFQRSFHYLDV